MADSDTSYRPIRRLLVANRGEIATRIIQSAREANIETFALITTNDTSHALQAVHALELPSPAAYLDVSAIVDLAKQHHIDAIHPGYGFLSESPELAQRAWDEAGALVIGPGPAILARTGDKLAAKLLAQECDVPTLPATTQPTQNVDDVRAFATQHGLPVMLKAVDGGGGKGIRLVRADSELESAARRAMAESPSGRVFVERAAVDGFRHVEVQIVGDGRGGVRHLWERECSVQRRFQKVVEVAPSTIADREFVARIIAAAVRMAERVRYRSLGTFEFLANPATADFFFLEVNPRLQVEHTVTEALAQLDIVAVQLAIAQGAALADTALADVPDDAAACPKTHAIQLRVTAEDPHRDWALSIGRIASFRAPTGHGVRVDTALAAGHPAIVSADFDSLLAKIIVSASSWPAAVAKAARALTDTRVTGVASNIDILRAVVASPTFASGRADTAWLEANLQQLLVDGARLARAHPSPVASAASHAAAGGSAGALASASSSTVLLRKGDAWSLALTPPDADDASASAPPPPSHHLKLTRVLRNEFPGSLRADIELRAADDSGAPLALRLDARSTADAGGASVAAGRLRRGDAGNPRHVVVPFAGRLVEVLVGEGDVVRAGDVVAVVRQMKMELEVRSRRAGRVVWVIEAEDGEDVAEGALAALLEDVGDGAAETDRSKL